MKRKIINHKWFCNKHKIWIGENYDCTFCKNDVKIIKMRKRSSFKNERRIKL